jgi:hypothetical protein
MRAKGPAEEVAVAFTRFENVASERGWPVRVENPGELAQGGGRFEIELANIDDEKVAHLAVQAAIDEVPGGPEMFTFA